MLCVNCKMNVNYVSTTMSFFYAHLTWNAYRMKIEPHTDAHWLCNLCQEMDNKEKKETCLIKFSNDYWISRDFLVLYKRKHFFFFFFSLQANKSVKIDEKYKDRKKKKRISVIFFGNIENWTIVTTTSFRPNWID